MKKENGKAKKPYRAPKVESRQIYEVNALGCAKCPSSSTISLQPACIRGTKQFS